MRKERQIILCVFLMLFLGFAFGAKKKTPVKLSPDFYNWVYEYIKQNTGEENTLQAVLKISNHYKKITETDKQKVRKDLEKLSADLIKDQNYAAAVAVIDLYNGIIEDGSKKDPKLLYAKGHLYINQVDDTIKAREAILELQQCVGCEPYIEKLETEIAEVRNYVPADKELGGFWVSDLITKIDVFGLKGIEMPKYVIYGKEIKDSTVFVIQRQSPFLYNDCIVTKGLLSDTYNEPQSSQYLYAYARNAYARKKDSLYIAWSSEKLKNYNASLVGATRELTRNTAALLSANFAQRHEYSFAENLVGSFSVGLAEAGINSIIDALTTPSKKLYLLEGRFRRGNKNIYIGRMKYLQVKARVGEEPVKKEYSEDMSLLRWTKESGVVFMYFKGMPLTPYQTSTLSIEKQKKIIEKQKQKNERIIRDNEKAIRETPDGIVPKLKPLVKVDVIYPYWKDIRDDVNTEFGKAYIEYEKSKDKRQFINEWNRKQIRKLRDYNASH